MEASELVIVIAIVVLGLILALGLVLGRLPETRRLTPLAGLAFALVLAGIFFGQERPYGYVLMGGGIVLALVDLFLRLRTR